MFFFLQSFFFFSAENLDFGMTPWAYSVIQVGSSYVNGEPTRWTHLNHFEESGEF